MERALCTCHPTVYEQNQTKSNTTDHKHLKGIGRNKLGVEVCSLLWLATLNTEHRCDVVAEPTVNTKSRLLAWHLCTLINSILWLEHVVRMRIASICYTCAIPVSFHLFRHSSSVNDKDNDTLTTRFGHFVLGCSSFTNIYVTCQLLGIQPKSNL